MNLGDIPFDKIEIGQRVQSNATNMTGTVDRTYIDENRYRQKNPFVVIIWDDEQISHVAYNWGLWMREISVLEDPVLIEESIPCDNCGKEITDFKNDLLHVAGILDGKFNEHIRLCKECFEHLKVPEIDLDALRKVARSYTTSRPSAV